MDSVIFSLSLQNCGSYPALPSFKKNKFLFGKQSKLKKESMTNVTRQHGLWAAVGRSGELVVELFIQDFGVTAFVIVENPGVGPG